MNVALLKQVRAKIPEEAERFDMDRWIAYISEDGRIDDEDEVAPEDRCGTVACIAGWTCLIACDIPPFENAVMSKARDLLGLDYWGARRLFFYVDWPTHFYNQYRLIAGDVPEELRNKKAIAQLAAERIDHFIATGS